MKSPLATNTLHTLRWMGRFTRRTIVIAGDAVVALLRVVWPIFVIALKVFVAGLFFVTGLSTAAVLIITAGRRR